MRSLLVALVTAALFVAAPARAATVRVAVRGAGDAPLADAVVAYESTRFAVTDARGEAALELPDGDAGVIWVRSPEGYAPGPAWVWWDGAAAGPLAIALAPLAAPVPRPLRLVVASDPHISAAQPFGADLAAVARDAVVREDAGALVLLGDLAQGALPEQYAAVTTQLADLGVPVVRVPGNHDWYDLGAAWTSAYGPASYSFDLGGAHFVVWNMALPDAAVTAFLAADLAGVRAGTPLVGLTHAPPSPEVIAALREHGVATLLTGHLHGNRVVDHDGLRELSTEALLMGGIDGTPAGYRVVTLGASGVTSEHRTLVDAPVLALARPAPGTCVPPGAVGELLVAASTESVTARVDCGTPIALRAAGGWTFRGALPALAPGPHAIALDAPGAHARAVVTACTPVEGSGPLGPPLVARWTVAVGGHVLAAPVIASGVAYVVTTDLADGAAGGVAALDLATGALRWRAPTAVPVRGSVAVVGEVVTVAQIDGAVLGLDAATGAVRWRTEVSEGVAPPAGAVFAGPTADDGDVLVGGQRRFAALDARTGRERWVVDPVPDAPAWVDFVGLAPVVVARGLVVGAFAREQSGLEAFDRATGARAWRVDELTVQPDSPAHPVERLAIGISGAPVVAGDTLYIATSADEVAALTVDTGAVRWRTQLDPSGFEWGAAVLGTPALADGVLVVPTLDGDAVALDAASGAELWRYAAPAPSPLRVTHYRGAGEAGFAAAPVIRGGVVWLAATDGTLVALALATGAELWRQPLGAPVLAGLAATDGVLVIAGYDGTVRALGPGAPAMASELAACDAPPRAGCCEAGGSAPALPTLAVGLALRRRRRVPAG